MQLLPLSPANSLTLAETLARLRTHPLVDGLALFGSQTTDSPSPVSDYDLLILVREQPVRIFQMLTYIGERMADVVLVETEMVDRLLASPAPVAAASWEGMFLQKMRQAEIRYDVSERLERAATYAAKQAQNEQLFTPTTISERYSDWFWYNHSLLHIKRMAAAADALYQTAVDLMLLGGLAAICRVYARTHNLVWEGEKAALRYLQAHDPGFVVLLRACLAATDRQQKIALYEQLVTQAIDPTYGVWSPGITAIYLTDPPQDAERLGQALQYWEELLRRGAVGV